MKSFRKALGIALCLVLMMQVCIVGAVASEDYTIINPYKDVIWNGEGAWGAYKGTLHSHTTYSDADDTLPVMVKEYYNQDYDFLAIADHGITGVDWNKAPAIQILYTYQLLIDNPYEHLTDDEYEQIKNGTYPLYNNTARGKKLVPVLGANEFNNLSLSKNHVNGYFLPADKGNGFPGMENEEGFEQAIRYIDENDGLSHINHPGDWIESNANPEAVNDPANVKFFGDLILKYDSCLGMEVFNEDNGTTGYDRTLWDNLLMHCLPYGKNVIAFSNTDAHDTNNVDTSFSVFMMEENTSDNVKKTMQNGAFFAITRRLRKNVVNGIGPEEEFDARNQGLPYPMFTDIDIKGHKITVSAKDSQTLKWIADGKVIFEKEIGAEPVTINLDEISGAKDFQYVRAELSGKGGMCISQAFAIDDGSEPLEFRAETGIDAIVDRILTFLKGTKAYTIFVELMRMI